MYGPLVWRLYDTCGVHHVSSVRGHDIFMFVEKEYPLTRGTLRLMMVARLLVEADTKQDLFKRDQQKGDVIKELSVPVSVVSASTKDSAATTITAIIPTPRKGIVFQEPGTTTTTTISSQQPSQANVQDKSKGKMVELEKPMKKKELIRLDKEITSKIQPEFDKEVRLAREKAEKEQEANVILIEEWDDIQAKIEAAHELAQRLQAQEQEELSDAKKATLFDSAATIITATILTPRKGIVFQEPSSTTTTTISSQQPSQANVQDKARLAREKAEKEQEANVILTEEWDDIQAKIKAAHELAQRLQAQEQEELSDAKKATLFVQLLKKRRKHFAAKRVEKKRNKPPTQTQQRKIICTYLKNMEGKKPKDLKNKSFDSIQKMFDRLSKG
ncbi:hypothetical protein Tco_1504839 [Tanacetum coccineum]